MLGIDTEHKVRYTNVNNKRLRLNSHSNKSHLTTIGKHMKHVILFSLFWILTLPAARGIEMLSRHEANISGAVFVENKGQFRNGNQQLVPEVLFKASVNGVDVYLTRTGISYVLSKGTQQAQVSDAAWEDRHTASQQFRSTNREIYRVDMRLSNSNPSVVAEGEGVMSAYNNYYDATVPEGILGVRRFSKIIYRDIYPSIDWVVYIQSGSNGAQLKYDFIVRAGGNPDDISWRYIGADEVLLDEQRLTIETPLGNIIEHQPYTYQPSGTGALSLADFKSVQRVASSFIISKNEVHFKIGAYDANRVLTIDPDVLWSTYFGGSGAEVSYGIAADANGNVYAGGYSNSVDLPVSPGVVQTVNAGADDLFVAAFSKDGQLLWSTYYGGSRTEIFRDILVDKAGNISLTGFTASSNFPVSSNAFQRSYGGGEYDGFLLKLNNSGRRVWATYYGGNGIDNGFSIAADDDETIVLVGASTSTNLPVDSQTFQQANAGDYDIFIAKLDAEGALVWSSYIGGETYDQATGVTIDRQGNIFLSGSCASTDFPVTPDAFQTVYGGGERDALLVKFTKDGKRLWATYYGGSAYDEGFQVDTDQFDYIFLGGSTFSPNLPVTPDAYQKSIAGVRDAYAAVFDGDGRIAWATYCGGNNRDGVDDIRVNSKGEVVLAGFTNSTNFPVTSDAIQISNRGDYDGFLTIFSLIGTLQSSTYFGGNKLDDFVGLDITADGDLVLSGETQSADLFVTDNAFSKNYNGGEWDAFVVRFGATQVSAGPPVVSDVVKDCFSVAFTVSAPGAAISEVLLDFLKSSNVAISVLETPPAGSFRVELRMLDRSKLGYFVVHVANTQGKSVEYSDTLYPAASVFEVISPLVAGEVVLATGLAGDVGCHEVLLKNTTTDIVVIPMLACVANTSFSAPPGQFPITLQPGDTAPVVVCYVPADASLQRDTLVGDFGCLLVRVPLASKGEIFTPGNYAVEGNCGIPLTLSGARVSGIPVRSFPTPASDIAVVPVSLQPSSAAQALLYNALGIAVAAARFEKSGSETPIGDAAGAWIFSVADLPSGVYYAVIPLGHETTTVVIPVAR